MQINDKMSDAEFAAGVAISAGKVLLDIRKNYKGEMSKDERAALRKKGDLISHNHIKKMISEFRPDDSLLSEEGKDDLSRLDAERVWIVDPLDGTREYGELRKDFAVHIALWLQKKQKIGASAITLPAQDLVYDTKMDISIHTHVRQDIRLVVSRTRPPLEIEKILENIHKEHKQDTMTFDVGSVGAKVNEIILGRADAYVHTTGFYSWDVAAPAAIAIRAGLHVSDVHGQPLRLNEESPYIDSLIVSKKKYAESILKVYEKNPTH